MERNILIVEDDPTTQRILLKMVQKINPHAKVDLATSAEEAMIKLTRDPNGKKFEKNEAAPLYHLVISDIGLAGIKSGLDLVNECVWQDVSTHFVLTSGDTTFESHHPFMPKPLRFSDVEACIGPYLRDSDVNEQMTNLPAAHNRMSQSKARSKGLATHRRIKLERFAYFICAVLVIGVSLYMKNYKNPSLKVETKPDAKPFSNLSTLIDLK